MHTPLLRLASVFVAALTVSAPAQLKLIADHPVSLHAGEGAATFTLKNSGTSPVPLNLTAGPVVDAATHTVLLKARTVLSPVVATSAAATIAPGDSVSYQATVSGISGVSTAHVSIYNAGTDLGPVSLVEIDAPLGITIDGDGAPDKPLAFALREYVILTLKNNDPESYRIHWKLWVAGKAEGESDIDIASNATARIGIRPTADVFSVYDRLHPSARQGVLVLTTPGSANLPAGLLPSRTLPVDLLMRRVSPSASTFFSYVYAGIFLLLGGILSIVASSVLPNMQKKVELRSQVKGLANRTTSVSTRIDSYLRVLLRLERKRIEIAIREISAWLPASADPLSHISVTIATLDKRLTAAESLDELRRKHEQASTTAPPSISELIDAKLQAAAEQLHSLNLSDADLGATNTLLASAKAYLDMLGDNGAVTKLIATNVAGLNARIAKFPMQYVDDLKVALAGVWVILDRGFEDPKNIVCQMFFSIDHGVAAIHLALDYAMVRASVPVIDANCARPGKTVSERLAQRHCQLIELLGTLSWRALREATNLVAQMREDIYEEDVLAEISKQGQAELTYDTQKPRPFLPVFFTVSFKDSRFNGAAAIQRMVCRWSFPDGLNELNWKVCHYFSGNERSAAMPVQSGAPAVDAPAPAPVEHPVASLWEKARHSLRIKKPPVLPLNLAIHASVHGQRLDVGQEPIAGPLMTSIQVSRMAVKERARFFAEFLRFIIAFGVALAGLLSGALGQLEKLDLIPATVAILALGFGADSIKNLLTQTPRKS